MAERLAVGTWIELEKNPKFRSASEIKSLGVVQRLESETGAKAGK